MPPGTTCSPTSKDTTIVSGSIPPSGISHPNRQSAKPLNPVSTKSQEGQLASRRRIGVLADSLSSSKRLRAAVFDCRGWWVYPQLLGLHAQVSATSERQCKAGATETTRRCFQFAARLLEQRFAWYPPQEEFPQPHQRATQI